MEIKRTIKKIREVADGYVDNGDNGVWGYGGKLNIRADFQRAFIYKDKQRDAVIDTVIKGYPLNVMYWSKTVDGFEVLDGQQRTISVCTFINNEYSISYNGKPHTFNNLPDDIQKRILDYDLDVYECDGSDSEKLEWFRTINIAGEKLTDQELLNAVYHGPFVEAAKRYFSANNCVAERIFGKWLSGSRIRQDYLETALKWVASSKNLTIEEYMSKHQSDGNCDELKTYFSSTVDWVKRTFPEYDSSMKGVNWGKLYNLYKDNTYNPDDNAKRMHELLGDDEIQNSKGIYEYILSGSETSLDLRTFDARTKKIVYERQKGICPRCAAEGITKVYELNEMDADHILTWHDGGRTVIDNCQMLCIKHNRGDKSWKSRD